MQSVLVTLALSILVVNVASEQDFCRSPGKACSAYSPCCGNLGCFKTSTALGVCREKATMGTQQIISTPTQMMPIREAKSDSSGRWPSGVVPYTTDKKYTRGEVQQIRRAMDEMTHLTKKCVKFVERTTESDYVKISRGYGCFSAGIGRVGGVQQVSLPIECLREMGDIQHELMHTLGFYHEHARVDRDSYITVIWENVSPDKLSQFEVENSFTFGLPYDYDSVMHYRAEAFGKFVGNKRLNTLKSKTKYERQHLGQRRNLSPLDIKRIQLRYGCRITDVMSPESGTGPRVTGATCLKGNGWARHLNVSYFFSFLADVQPRTFQTARTFCREQGAQISPRLNEETGEFFRAQMCPSMLDSNARVYVANCNSISPGNVQDPEEEDCGTELHFICAKDLYAS